MTDSATSRSSVPKAAIGVLSRGILFAGLLIGLIGCVPVQRVQMKTSDEEIRISPNNGKKSLSVEVLTQTSDPSQKPGIDMTRSFAISPRGERFNIRAQKNEYANNSQISPWTANDLYLVDPSQKTDSGDLVRWKNGNWKPVLVEKPVAVYDRYASPRIKNNRHHIGVDDIAGHSEHAGGRRGQVYRIDAKGNWRRASLAFCRVPDVAITPG